jgi:hypothetical protein
MKDENYIHIAGWMINRLKLEGTDLLIYAIIYGFSQDGINKFTGSLSYLEKATNKSRSTVIRSLSSMCESGLLIKESYSSNGVLFANYKVNHRCFQFETGSIKMTLPQYQNDTRGSIKMTPNSNSNNKNEIKLIEREGADVSIFLKRWAITEESYKSLVDEFVSDCTVKGIPSKQDHFVRWVDVKMKKSPTKEKGQLVNWDMV